MAILYENYITGRDGLHGSYATYVVGQTFKPQTTHEITSVKLFVRRLGTLTNVTVEIYATSSNLPTGSALVSKAIDGSGWNASTFSWEEWVFSTNPELAADTVYAIVISGTGYDVNNTPIWGYDGSSPAYTRGNLVQDTGGGWTANTTVDFLFEEYGNFVTNISYKTYSKKLVAIGSNEVWYEATAGIMLELTAANGDIDTNNPLNVAMAFQKLFIANGTNLKVVDFVNTKITTSNVGTNAPDFGVVLTGGTSGAKMIVDYITSTSSACVIYGKRTTTDTFQNSETVTGTNPSSSPYGSAVSFTTSAAETAPPHWYDYTVFGADATNYGVMPTNVNQVCRYRGRIQLSGDPNYPHQWYQSRQFNPFDFLYVAGDAQSPVAGDDADAGVVGDIVKVGIPYSDDFLIFGCANELWVMSGDAAFGGELNPLDTTTGILGDRAWCWDDVGNLYMICTVGLLVIPRGFGQIENLTIELWPDFISDLAFDASAHRITLAFDPENRGIYIFKTTLSTGVSSAWWYDLRTKGLFPDSYSIDHGAFSAFYYQSEDPTYRRLLVGCNDGYIRYWDRTAKNDDSTAIDSYIGFTLLALSTHPRKDGIIKNLDLVSGGGASGGSQSDSDNVLCSVHVGRTAEQVIEKLDGGTTAAYTKTFVAPGWVKGNLDRRTIRGQWAGIVLSNNTAGESWSIERLIVDGKPDIGRSL